MTASIAIIAVEMERVLYRSERYAEMSVTANESFLLGRGALKGERIPTGKTSSERPDTKKLCLCSGKSKLVDDRR